MSVSNILQGPLSASVKDRHKEGKLNNENEGSVPHLARLGMSHAESYVST